MVEQRIRRRLDVRAPLRDSPLVPAPRWMLDQLLNRLLNQCATNRRIDQRIKHLRNQRIDRSTNQWMYQSMSHSANEAITQRLTNQETNQLHRAACCLVFNLVYPSNLINPNRRMNRIRRRINQLTNQRTNAIDTINESRTTPAKRKGYP